ncbi:hypothetical protein Cadr_000007938, partial [Camelus dromedarius]
LPGLRIRVRWTQQLCSSATAVAASASCAKPVTSGTLSAPPTRAGAPFAAGSPSSPAPARRPGGGCWGRGYALGGPRRTLCEPEAPAARLRLGGLPTSFSGHRAASLGGGEEGAVALASSSRSSPAHAPVLRAPARAQPGPPSFPPPPPALPLARPPPPPHQSSSRPPPAPDSLLPEREAAGTAAARPPTRKLFRRQPRGCKGCEPGSDLFAPVAAGGKAKALEDLSPLVSGEGEGCIALRCEERKGQ